MSLNNRGRTSSAPTSLRTGGVEAASAARAAVAFLLSPLQSPFGLSAVLLLYGNFNSLVPWEIRSRYLIIANLLLLAVLLFEAVRASGFSFDELGMGWGDAKQGISWGIGTSLALATLPVAFITLAPFATGEPVHYGDIVDLSAGTLAYRILVMGPIGTAFFEEAAFRGVLYAKVNRVSNEIRAVLLSSLVFMLWHVVITSRTVVESDVVESAWLVPPAIAVSLAGTFIGGLVFAWLRWRTRHIAAPFLVHWLTVAFMSLAVWLRA